MVHEHCQHLPVIRCLYNVRLVLVASCDIVVSDQKSEAITAVCIGDRWVAALAQHWNQVICTAISAVLSARRLHWLNISAPGFVQVPWMVYGAVFMCKDCVNRLTIIKHKRLVSGDTAAMTTKCITIITQT